jgi:4-amino-4-deoxy-L-arabinose transferase-like glycosyltransferase
MKKYWLLILALVIGAFLRLYQLGLIPNALTWDEAALGYNAYSILKTGRDEYGKILPIIFKSFGDYKPGLYVYLAVPSVAVLGLTEVAVRLPGALFGILAILGVFLLTKEIFREEKRAHLLASFAALGLAIMPLHVHFSRGAWVTNVFCTLLLFSVYYLLKFIRTGKYLNWSLILALLTLITYQAAKILTPLIIGLTILVFWQSFWKNLKDHLRKPLNLGLLVIATAFILYILVGATTGEEGNRLKRLSIFGYRPEITQQTKNIDDNNGLTLSLFHNQPQLTIRLIAGRYLKHFSPKVLFYEGTAVVERGHFPGLGALQPFDFIWLIPGLIYLVKNKNIKAVIFVLGLLFLAPLPGSLTISDYSTVRSLFMTIPLAILIGLGYFYALAKSKLLFYPLLAVTIVIFVYFTDLLFVHANFTYAHEFQYGYREAIQFANRYPDSKVVMTDVFGQPYIFYLFYTRFDPATYQNINNFESGGVDVGKVSSLGRAEFHQFSVGEFSSQPNTVFIGTIGNVPEDYQFDSRYIEAHADVPFPDGEPFLRLIKTKASEK